MKTNYDDEYLEGLRAIIKQSEREKWNSFDTSMAIQMYKFGYDMKYCEPESKGVISDE